MLRAETLARIKHLEFKARYLVTDVVAGQYLSAFKGRGMEFDEVRPYTPGDEVRLIDWNVSARMQEPFIKVHREERELSVMLLVDNSRSMAFGTSEQAKRDAAAEASAIFAFLATKNNDRVGLISFSQGVDTFIPPSKGRAHVWNIIRSLLAERPKSGGTDLKAATQLLMNIAKRRILCIVISDFRSMKHMELLSRIRSRHELICLELSDAAELSPVEVGLVQIEDLETGADLTLDFSDPQLRRLWQESERKRAEDFHTQLRRLDAAHVVIRTDEDTMHPIERFLQHRSGAR